MKNRIHATLAKYALKVEDASDIFGKRARQRLNDQLKQLPEHTRYATERLMEELTDVQDRIRGFEEKMAEVFAETQGIKLLMTEPGVGFILGTVVAMELGTIDRFATAEKFAAYAGTTPRVKASGGKVRYGRLRPDVNRYLKWAFVEAANTVCLNQKRWALRHVTLLYQRIKSRKGHPKAIGAVARHLAEATYWMLTKNESYREPELTKRFRPREGKRA